MKWIKVNGHYIEPENIEQIREAHDSGEEIPDPVYKRKLNLYEEFCKLWATEALRVLKPGGHMLAFSGSRTFHRLFVGVEDAGFEVRDSLMWMYGNGFPKGHNISKSIDEKLGMGGEREVVGVKPGHEDFAGRDTDGHLGGDGANDGWKRPWMDDEDAESYHMETAPATSEAERWDGWDTQLKPAFEPVVLARKPLEEDTIAEQVMTTGTGALNIDECRIPTDDEWEGGEIPDADTGVALEGSVSGELNEQMSGSHEMGRHPANVALDQEAAGMLDEQTGELHSSGVYDNEGTGTGEGVTYMSEKPAGSMYTDCGGPSRFFYTSKATKSERTVGGNVDCPHPTVKPIDLMEWMVKMVSAEGQTVLDPFAGSGTTLMASYNLGRNAIGIERDSEYVEIAKERVRANESNVEEVGTEPEHIYDDAMEW